MPPSDKKYTLVIHGGAGTLLREHITPEQEADYQNALNASLNAGEAILKNSGSAIEAVEAAIQIMEDSPLFNAGKGSVFTHEGSVEMDAAIMSGADLQAGALAGVSRIKNPISAACAVMENSEHILLVGEGAEAFAAQQNIEQVDPDYFFTVRRWDALQRAKSSSPDNTELDHDDFKFGTVGAVALDQHGNLAAGTSTGGMTNKRWGRVGDSPLIGSGTYANNNSCAVSATGHGECFIRHAVAHDISARMRYLGISLQEAADQVVNDVLVENNGAGGVIAVDAQGNIAMPFNTTGMYRGFAKPDSREVAIYKE